jgi:hypothetical protein
MESVLDACLLAEENNYAQLDALLKVTELLEVAEDKAIREVVAYVALKKPLLLLLFLPWRALYWRKLPEKP